MDLVAFQYDRSFVLDALRHGDVDYLEHVSEAAEADLFRHLIRRQVIHAWPIPIPRRGKNRKFRSGFIWPANSASNSTAPRAITLSRASCAAVV